MWKGTAPIGLPAGHQMRGHVAMEVPMEPRSSPADSVPRGVPQKPRGGGWLLRQGGYLPGLESLSGACVAQSRDNEDKTLESF